jgi:hypothetical protein
VNRIVEPASSKVRLISLRILLRIITHLGAVNKAKAHSGRFDMPAQVRLV